MKARLPWMSMMNEYLGVCNFLGIFIYALFLSEVVLFSFLFSRSRFVRKHSLLLLSRLSFFLTIFDAFLVFSLYLCDVFRLRSSLPYFTVR